MSLNASRYLAQKKVSIFLKSFALAASAIPEMVCLIALMSCSSLEPEEWGESMIWSLACVRTLSVLELLVVRPRTSRAIRKTPSEPPTMASAFCCEVSGGRGGLGAGA
ncbi:Uncharacterised protein [Mycobacteroides abscessus subsp. abscessus]|nr:Uncharacterised protein [Mycobacteroides abscessus subsp. abscessus]